MANLAAVVGIGPDQIHHQALDVSIAGLVARAAGECVAGCRPDLERTSMP